MATATKRPVGADRVREAYRSGRLDPAKVVNGKGDPVSTASLFGSAGDSSKVRGRLAPAFIEHFNAQTKDEVYAEGQKTERTVTVTVERTGKNGRALKPATHEVPLSEVRSISGQAKGKISAASLAKVAATLA